MFRDYSRIFVWKVGKKEDLPNEKQKRKTEVEEKLQVLNDKKHSLVQLLKQVNFSGLYHFVRYSLVFL